MIDKVNAEF